MDTLPRELLEQILIHAIEYKKFRHSRYPPRVGVYDSWEFFRERESPVYSNEADPKTLATLRLVCRAFRDCKYVVDLWDTAKNNRSYMVIQNERCYMIPEENWTYQGVARWRGVYSDSYRSAHHKASWFPSLIPFLRLADSFARSPWETHLYLQDLGTPKPYDSPISH